MPIRSTYRYGMLYKQRIKLLVILSLRVSNSPVQLCVVKEKSSQKRGAHWMPRHHEKKDRNAILRLKHICRPLKSYCIWVATKFFVYKSWGELFFLPQCITCTLTLIPLGKDTFFIILMVYTWQSQRSLHQVPLSCTECYRSGTGLRQEQFCNQNKKVYEMKKYILQYQFCLFY